MGHRQPVQGRRHFDRPSRIYFGDDREVSPCAAAYRRRERGVARRADGQLRGGTPQYRCGPRGLSGFGEDQPRLQGRFDHGERGGEGGFRVRQGEGRERALHGPRVGRRRALVDRPPLQTLRHRQDLRHRAYLCTLLHGRPRYRPAQRQGFHRGVGAPYGAVDGRRRVDHRPLLCDGSRQALGACEGGLRSTRERCRRAGDGHGRRHAEVLRRRRDRRVRQADRACRRRGESRRDDPSRRHGDLLQLPQRPRQGADRRAHAGGHARRRDARCRFITVA